MSETTRGGFIGMIAAAVAAPAVASEAKSAAPSRMLRCLVMYDLNYVSHKEAGQIGSHLADMGLQGPIVGVDFRNPGEPIRLVNIDNIPPETVKSLTAKFREFGDV